VSGARTLVLGLGRFGGGAAAARHLWRHGHRVRIADQAGPDSLADAVRALADTDVEWCLGRQDEALLDGVERVVVNPAIPPAHPLLQAARARGLVCTQEVELFLAAYPGRVVVVTGTNGKSSTTTLCAAVLRRSGPATLCGGNIGHSLLDDEDRWRADQVAVLEVSSFQLERLDPERCAVEGAVITRVTEDHVDRHGTVAAYHRAKATAARLARRFVVHAADDPVASGFTTPAPTRRTFALGAADAAATLDRGWLRLGRERLAHRDALLLTGDFQVENALAAALVGERFAVPAHAIGVALATARPLRWRLACVGRRAGCEWWDNAVSTVPESTLSALRALGRGVRWVGGGRSKAGHGVLPDVARALAPLLASAHLFGDVAVPLGSALSALGVPTTVHERVPAALDAAQAAARAGDRLLFSPGFASFDQYPNFRARAEEFERWLALAVDPLRRVS